MKDLVDRLAGAKVRDVMGLKVADITEKERSIILSEVTAPASFLNEESPWVEPFDQYSNIKDEMFAYMVNILMREYGTNSIRSAVLNFDDYCIKHEGLTDLHHLKFYTSLAKAHECSRDTLVYDYNTEFDKLYDTEDSVGKYDTDIESLIVSELNGGVFKDYSLACKAMLVISAYSRRTLNAKIYTLTHFNQSELSSILNILWTSSVLNARFILTEEQLKYVKNVNYLLNDDIWVKNIDMEE